MNSSYKIVLLAAFVLFAAVVVYYMFSGPGDEPATGEPAVAQGPPIQDPPAEEETDNPGGVVRSEVEPGPEIPPLRPPTVTVGNAEELELGEFEIDTTERVAEGPETVEGPLRGIRGEEEETETETGGTPPTTETETETGNEPPVVRNLPGAGTPETESGPGTEVTETEEEAPVRPLPRYPENDPEADPETADPPSNPNPGAPRIYTVQGGDTLSGIAVREYGEQRYWYQIAQANPSIDPERLRVGQQIVLPNLAAVEEQPTQPTLPPPTGERTYTVRSGDTLSSIAQRYFGDPNEYGLIFNRNRDQLDSPDDIREGMTLIIPTNPDGAQ